MAKKGAQIVALIALLCIVISAISTGILVILGGNNNQANTELTPEQLEELQQIINSQSGTTTSSGEITNTGEIINNEEINEENVEAE